MKEFDFFVIGGGSGGVRAARIAAGHGARVALAESSRIGGTCVIRGCVPKKLMVLASRYAPDFDVATGFGWTVGERRFDWQRLRSNVAAEVSRLEAAYTTGLSQAGVSILHDHASLEGPGVVRISGSGERIRARHILIATGARPTDADNLPGAELASNSDAFFEWPSQPARVLVQGAGYIALELGCLLQRLGSQVTLVMRGATVLRGFDNGLREHLQQALLDTGLAIMPGCTVTGLTRHADGSIQARLSDGSSATFDAVLRATGRQPNTRELNLERVGVTTSASGAIIVDEWSQTSVAGIYAVGDVTGRAMLTPAAVREGHALADALFGGRKVPIAHDLIPTAVFTTPEAATVGLGEEDAIARFGAVDVYEARFKPMKHAMSAQPERMLIKVIVDRLSDRVLGVHIVGLEAAEMIQLAGIALQMGATKAQFDTVLPVHPTAAEEIVTLRAPTRRHG
ncbi:glutathione-disulfide reductase [Diaphorobacter sp. JS3051]|uniref:glutathione-disulfide reductase n=2 Tax=Diaphorobacter sp. JS3051 TaxID=2792224 RepID=UPI001E4EBDBF|nr:glutathione-disulfide reductase [Diaphorobacter sp. JS3051]